MPDDGTAKGPYILRERYGNLGHPCDPRDRELAAKWRDRLRKRYDNGHTDETVPHTGDLRVRLTDGGC